MIRSRDYVLFLIIVLFLLVGIGTTVVRSYQSGALFDTTSPLDFVDTSDVDRVAVIPDESVTTRTERLAQLRQKIAANGLVRIAAPESIPNTVTTTTETSLVSLGSELRCADYQTFAGSWPAGVQQELVEGARVLFVPIESEAIRAATTTTFVPTRTILAELPVRSTSLNAQNCIPSDVIGVTVSGALIKNDFAYAYAGWSENTLIGYALDGYPIYGLSEAVPDGCGGVVVAGEYRYQISPERNTIIRCFSGTPTQL